MAPVFEMADVERLDVESVFTMPVTRDWSSGYGETWRPLGAPSCPDCGERTRWLSYEEADALLRERFGDERADSLANAAVGGELDAGTCWRCADVDCSAFGRESEGDPPEPMMNYSYPLPNERPGGWRGYDETDAELIGDLPLVLVLWEDGERDADLALTGGGMDLSFDICDAFARLGLCPPLHFCPPETSGERGNAARFAWVLAACRRSVLYAARRVERIAADLDELQGPERFPLATPANMRRAAELTEDWQRLAAWSPSTGETVSATAGDYFMLADDEPVRGEDGEPLRLVTTERGSGPRLVPAFDPAQG